MGVKVLDLSQVMAGPFCTMLLGDMGAEVTKVEPPHGDSSRRMSGSLGTESPSYWAVNRNKRGIVVNLRDPQGVEICRRLTDRADILVEKLPSRHPETARLWLRGPSGGESGVNLRLDLRLRTDRTICGARRV